MADKRAKRDRAGVGPDPDRSRRRLISIDDLDGYSIGKGEPDIRGWDVRTVSGRELGEVGDLLVDPERGEVVMLEVSLRGENVHDEVPIRAVQLDRRHNVVLVDSGDVDARSDVRARDRIEAVERERIRTEYGDRTRDVRYADRDEHDAEHRHELMADDDVDEVVVDSRPMVEEVVVRRRPSDE
jgi:sporulation protein YlmC with PRC-barrel domain